MPVSLSTEQEEQRRWKLRQRFSRLKTFDQLVANEFLTRDERRLRQEKALTEILQFSSRQVPYYGKMFERLNILRAATTRQELMLRIPLLTKDIIQENETALIAARLPKGGKIGGATATSGTSGKSLRILHSMRSHEMFHILSQRSRRWYRFDPQGTAAAIRQRPNLPRRPDGTPLPDGETLELPAWPGIGQYFETDRFIGFAKSNALERIADWIEKNQPDYMQTDGCRRLSRHPGRHCRSHH